MMQNLTTKILNKAKKNAALTRAGRIVVWNKQLCSFFDYQDTEEIRQKVGKKNIYATVTWGGRVERLRKGRK